MTDLYERKYEEMQKYVPFIERVIEKLKVNNDNQEDNPRKAQLQKMEMLHDLLTNKQKKIKIETLMKCEGVLIKLQTKIEKQATNLQQNEDAILSDVKMKNKTSGLLTASASADTKYQEDILGPASPPPESVTVDDINQPVVIPTERRCSPILVKELAQFSAEKSQQQKNKSLDDCQSLRKKDSNIDCKPGSSKAAVNKQNPSQDSSFNQNSNKNPFKFGTRDHHHHHHGKESQHQKHSKQQNEQKSHSSRERNAKTNKSPTPEQKLQTVKVVITEPLPPQFRQQHFPPASRFLPRSSVCHNNLKTLPQSSQTKTDSNEAYSPEESWSQINEPNAGVLNAKMPTTVPVFSRLGEKIFEDTQKSQAPGRYTPIPDVLKSPPLSVSDINNLLLESGSDKTLKDISEIGTRRPPKVEDSQKEADKNSLEFVRKKLAQTAKLSSPQTESNKRITSPLPNERLALKYNPHPRQERLPSASSTDSSECSIQSKLHNSRINPKLPISISQRSPAQVAAVNVNVLPAINLSDPRLKRHSIPLSTPPTLLPTPPTFISNQPVGFSNQNSMIYCRRKDPRMSHTPNNASSPAAPTTPFRRMSTNQPQYDSEENWDSDEKETPLNNASRNARDNLNSLHLQKPGLLDESSISKQVHQKEQNLGKNKKKDKKKSKSDIIPATTYVVPNAPKSDTEEDWDVEPQTTNSKAKPMTTNMPQSPMNVVSSYHSQISPKGLVSPILPAPQQQQPQKYLNVGSNIHNPSRLQNPLPNNRFNSILNDTSERIKYFESKKQKSVEPRTYKEFREAKERALAHEAALKSAAAEAEAKKRCHETKEVHTGAAKMQNANEPKVKQIDTLKKGDDKKEKKSPHNDTKKCLAGESTLDKMYRTQNFNTSFPKANTSFKIPKKKTEDQIKDDAPKSNEAKTKRANLSSANKLEEKFKSSDTHPATDKIKSTNKDLDKKPDIKKLHNATKHLHTLKRQEGSVREDKSKEKEASHSVTEGSTKEAQPITDHISYKSDNVIKVEKASTQKHNEKETKEIDKTSQQNIAENLLENVLPPEANQINLRDPRCRPKTTPPQEEQLKELGDIIITSSDNQLVLKPQQNLEKFNILTQQLSPKPQRILRRRNTMVVFDSAPLVDKEKLRKANALLFEDVQAEEKRKLKQAEEDRLIARRNKNLEEMFKKTDDNCTVSTQNIITGKRRTRATINFNETVNAINVFKHLTIKDTSAGNVTSAPSAPAVAQAAKPARSNFKIKIKNLALIDKQKVCESDDDGDGDDDDDDDDDDEDNTPLNRIANKEAKESVKPKPSKHSSKPKTAKETQLEEECKTDESETESKASKTQTKRSSISRKSSNCAENSDTKFTPIPNEEHQNCAVSSTSTDNYNVEETTCSSNSTQKSYKHEPDDNEPTSTAASKSYNPTPEPNEPILREIVDQILKPNSNREPILDILAQILSEDKLALIKTLIENSNKPNTDEQATKELEDADKRKSDKPNTITNTVSKTEHPGDEAEGEVEHKPIVSGRAGDTKKSTMPKKKRSELDRLNEDIRDMFICNGVLTATGRRMCTIMGKDVASTSGKESSKESTPSPICKQENVDKKKRSSILKPPTAARALRRSTRSCRTADDNEDNESILSRTTEDSMDDFNITTTDSVGTDATPCRKMPVLKPQTPIKIPVDVSSHHKAQQQRETGNKRKCDSKLDLKAKKLKIHKDDSKQDLESDEKNSDTEVDKADDEETEASKSDIIIKNTNLHWHNQSKYTTWCMICEKRIPANWCSVHYKNYHRENYISRMAPVLLQQYKQEKLSKPLFGVRKAQKQPFWFSRCPFCLKYFNTPLSLWLEHFQNHTVEFRYECSKCFRSSNKKLTISRHIKSCEDATLLMSAVKLSVPSVINAHVCHLCNFLQLKRDNLERHYIEQHQLQKKTVDLLGYTIKLFDVENVECVSEEQAAEKEQEVWKSIEKNEQIIDIDDDDDDASAREGKAEASEQASVEEIQKSNHRKQKTNSENGETSEHHVRENADLNLDADGMDKSKGYDFVTIEHKVTVQGIQDELLALAAEAAEKEDNGSPIPAECNNKTTSVSLPNDDTTSLESSKLISINSPLTESILSATDDASSDRGKVSQAASNVFMPSREEINYSPTVRILAQSIINIDEQESGSVKEKPITMAERLSQRFKNLQQSECAATEIINTSSKAKPNDNDIEKLIDDTLLELTKEKDTANKSSSDKAPATAAATALAPAVTGRPNENVFDKLFSDTVLELERDDLPAIENQSDLPQTDPITVISDDEDWEDIEITETAPTVSTAVSGSVQKTKSKGLFQKFGMFKGSNTKSKKHLSPMVFLPKKKVKEKTSLITATLSHSPITTTTTTAAAPTAAAAAGVPVPKANETTSNNTSPGNAANATNFGFKPVLNIMDGLFPDSPCNDPIDLVPELAPLEPLQDLNDISSILDSNLSAVNINAADNHTSIEDALDFVSEQQANDKQKLNPSDFSIMPSQGKTTINSISHVGFSVQNAGETYLKFYCLLQNCSFLYSSDSIGLEAHFMCEHSEIKWNGYCLMCQSQCLPIDADATAEHPISREIRHMMEKHANNSALDLNTDSAQHSNSSGHEAEGRPKIKLRRLTGDCLSRATPENVASSNDAITTADVQQTNVSTPLTMLGALLVADPKPPTIEMPPQPQMLLTEPLLLDQTMDASSSQPPFRNVNSDFLITSVTSSADPTTTQSPLQISNVMSLNKNNEAATPPASNELDQIQIPKISSVRTLAPKAGILWSQHIENDRLELAEAAAESSEVSRILANAACPPSKRSNIRSENDSPVLVAETVAIAQSTTGDFVVTQTVSAQYNESSSTSLGFNISIAASTTAGDNTNTVTTPASASSTLVASRQYKCMGSGCKFVSRVPVAMSDHLRFHERRNFSNKQDYLSCGFCFYCASDIDDYMNHANEFHIVNKGGTSASTTNTPAASEHHDTAISLTKKIHNILNSKNSPSSQSRHSNQNRQSNQAKQIQETQEVYLKKLRETIDEIVAPTGLADDKLYRCVVKNCHAPLTESTFLNHIMFHITTTGGNPNNYLFKCPHCTAQYHRPAGIKAHIKNHARNRYFCYLCEETSTNPGQLLKHFSEKHWHTLNMYTKELLPAKASADGSDPATESNYYVAYTQDLSPEELRKFGEKLILEWKRKKSGSKTHFKSSEIDLLPFSAIFQRQVHCGECEYKTKVRTNMFRHLQMHKRNPDLANKSGACSGVVDPVNPVPCLNSNERFFDKMTNLASSSLIPSSSPKQPTPKPPFRLPHVFVDESKRYVCGCAGCNYHTIADDLLRTHLLALHSCETSYQCPFCKEEVCKRGISFDRIINHIRFHGSTIYRCDECNYFHHLRYVVERHINEKHSTMKVDLVTHIRTTEDNVVGSTIQTPIAGKRYNEFEGNPKSQINNPAHQPISSESSTPKPVVAPTTATTTATTTTAKGKARWECDVCGHKATTVNQMQNHCQQQHSVKNQYKCAHCNFGSQQLSQILHHIDEKHSGSTREARTMYHKIFNNEEVVVDTRPLWQRNDPTRVRHIRGILMEDEEESEEYRKKLALTEDVDDESNEAQSNLVEENEELNRKTYISGYEFACYHCSFKAQTFEDLKEQHYAQNHNFKPETAKPFWYRLHRRLCCPECRSFIGSYNELQQHLQHRHKKRFYAADIKMAETDDSSQRILCGYCSFHSANAESLYKHHLKAQHWPQDIRIDNDAQIMDILALGKSELSYQCTVCADIFPNHAATRHHSCTAYAGEESFLCRELSNSLIYRCNSCCFTSTVEIDLLRHTIDHYSRFKFCIFCRKDQSSFNAYMQHCYTDHKHKIDKFRTIYPFAEIRKFLLQTLVIFPSGLVLNKRNLLNTKYGGTYVIDELYEEIYRISQQPPIPRLSIARLVARKSIEAQQKNVDSSSSSAKDDVFNAMLSRPKNISKRRCTVAFDVESNHSSHTTNSMLKPKTKTPSTLLARRITNDHDQQVHPQVKQEEFSAPLKANKISKRRRTVAVDRDTLFSSNLKSSTNTLLTELENAGRKRKSSFAYTSTPSPKHARSYPLNLDMEPFSYYGKKPESLDLSKIYTKVAIGGIKTPLTLDKFKLLFNIDCQLKLTKCDEDSQLMAYNDYKHIKKACPVSEKLKYE